MLTFTLSRQPFQGAYRQLDLRSGVAKEGSNFSAQFCMLLISPICNDFKSNSGADALIPDVTLRVMANDSAAGYRPLTSLQLTANLRMISRGVNSGRTGAKAGNLNYTLSYLLTEPGSERMVLKVFLLLDSDGCLAAPLELRRAEDFPWDNVAFLQTRQAGNPQQTGFPGIMAPWVEMHFDTMVALRAWNPGGFRMFYGHGALIPVAVWERCREAGREWRAAGEVVEPGDGGFPEIVTEDLAFTLRCRELGLRGAYTDAITCYEDFPETYGQLRKRTDKWIRGTGQCLVYYLRRRWRHWLWWWIDLTTKNTKTDIGKALQHRAGLGGWEIFDLTVHCVQHILAVPMLALVLYTCVILPERLSHARPIVGFVAEPIMLHKPWWKYLTEVRMETNWTQTLFISLLCLTILPLLPAVRRLWRVPVHLIKFIGVSIFLSLSGLVAETLAVLTFLLSGQAHFRVTGDKTEGLGIPGYPAEPPGTQQSVWRKWSRLIGSYHPNHPWVFLLEAAIGAWFCWKGYELKCLWSFGPGIALLTSPLFHYRGWNSLLVRCLIAIPAVLLLITMVLTWRTVFGNRLW